MKKQEAISVLLSMHCCICHGKTFGCRGCTREEDIKEIVNSIEDKPKKTTKK